MGIGFTRKISTLCNRVFNNSRYAKTQKLDIEKYGKKFVPRNSTVSDKMIKEYTPFRRKSNKPTNLSDNKWFIEKFETQTNKEYLPEKWSVMSEQQKADYIVTDRYSSLVANKIMSKIKDKPVEHSYRLYKGELTDFVIGDEHSVQCNFAISDTRVHNHPISPRIKNIKTKYVKDFLGGICPDLYTSKCAFSGQDIIGATITREKSYIIDSNGHRFLFEPKINPNSTEEQIKNAFIFRNLMNKSDKDSAEKLGCTLSDLIMNKMIVSNKVSKKSINESIDFLNKYGFDVMIPFLGNIRNAIYNSPELKTGILDKVGKYREI